MYKKRRKQALAVALAAVFACSQLQTVDASSVNKAKNAKKKAEEDLNETNRQIEAIEKQQSALQSEINEKDAELVNLLVNIDILKDELEEKNTQLTQVTEDLATAQETEKSQYAAMKKRIQFMYERGDTAMIESLLGSADMTDFLNRVEYVSDVYEYDRNLLTQYQITVQQVADLKVSVETEKAELEAMQEEYGQQQASLETILAQKRSQMGSYDNQLATAQAAADEFKQTIAAQNQIIKEEERKQREAEKAAEAAAKAAARQSKRKPVRFIFFQYGNYRQWRNCKQRRNGQQRNEQRRRDKPFVFYKYQRKLCRVLCLPICRQPVCLGWDKLNKRRRLFRFCNERIRAFWNQPAA